MTLEDGRYRALGRGLAILETVAEARGGLGVTALSNLTGIDKSSTSRLVSSLVSLGFLTRLENRHVVLTGRVLNLAKGFQQQYTLSEIARPILAALRDKVAETVILTVRQGSLSVSIEQFDPEHPFRMVPHVGNAAPLYATAAGRAIMFRLPVAEQRAIINELKDTDVEHPEVRLGAESWVREYELAKSRGYVWIPRTDDVERVAAAVLDRNGRPLAAVSVYGPKYRIKDRLGELGKEAVESAAKISRAAMGIRPGEPGP